MDNQLFISVLASHPKNKLLLRQFRFMGLILIPTFVYYSIFIDRYVPFNNHTFMVFWTLFTVMNAQFLVMQVYLQGTYDRIGFGIIMEDIKKYSVSNLINFDALLFLVYFITPFMVILNRQYYVLNLILWDVSFIMILVIAYRRGISIANEVQKQSAKYTRYFLIVTVLFVVIKQVALLPVKFILYQPAIQGITVILVFMLALAVMLVKSLEVQYFKLGKIEKYEKLLDTDSKIGSLSRFVGTLPSAMIKGKNYLNIASYCMIIIGIFLYLAVTNIPENTDVFTMSWASVAFYAFIIMGFLLAISLYSVIKTRDILTIYMIEFDKIMYNFEMTNKEFLEILEENESHD